MIVSNVRKTKERKIEEKRNSLIIIANLPFSTMANDPIITIDLKCLSSTMIYLYIYTGATRKQKKIVCSEMDFLPN